MPNKNPINLTNAKKTTISIQWVNFNLMEYMPVKGQNTLELTLVSRPDQLEADILLEDVELVIKYGSYPSRL